MHRPEVRSCRRVIPSSQLLCPIDLFSSSTFRACSELFSHLWYCCSAPYSTLFCLPHSFFLVAIWFCMLGCFWTMYMYREHGPFVEDISRDVHQAPMWTPSSPSIVAYLSVLSLSLLSLLPFMLAHLRAEASFIFHI